MSELSRRSVLRASGAAAAAVPISALVASSPDAATPTTSAEVASFGTEPVMFAVHDMSRGEVTILHGEHEVVVRDRDLVTRIVKAAARARRAG
jgi:Rieske Fe-S protein